MIGAVSGVGLTHELIDLVRIGIQVAALPGTDEPLAVNGADVILDIDHRPHRRRLAATGGAARQHQQHPKPTESRRSSHPCSPQVTI